MPWMKGLAEELPESPTELPAPTLLAPHGEDRTVPRCRTRAMHRAGQGQDYPQSFRLDLGDPEMSSFQVVRKAEILT